MPIKVIHGQFFVIPWQDNNIGRETLFYTKEEYNEVKELLLNLIESIRSSYFDESFSPSDLLDERHEKFYQDNYPSCKTVRAKVDAD